jgi:hypothetical protein
MKAIVFLALALLAAQGCLPERPAPVPPPPAAPSSDERALQTLSDLGVTPEIMLRLVRDQLASAIKPDEPDQPLPTPIEEEAPPAETVPAEPQPATSSPGVQAPAPAVPSPAPAAPAVEAPAMPAPPPPAPVAERLIAAVPPTQPAAAAATTTIILQQPVIIQQAQDFYSPLNSYGDWITLPAYGRVWRPTVTVVNAQWRPYYHGGRWIYTDCGWYWQSDYSWGWAVFHYGRWCYVDRHRWVWIPDTVWAPAWVSWRRSETHCGWAPLPPGATFRVGVGFDVGQGVQFDMQFGLSSRHYTFVANNRLSEPNLNSVIVHNEHVEAVYRNSRHLDNSYTWDDKQRRVHNQGPDRDAEDRAHRPVARPIRFVPPPAAPVITPALPVPPASAAPAAPPAAAPATPGAPPVTTPGRRPPRTTPSPAAPATPGAPPVTTPSPAAPATPGAPPVTTPGRRPPRITPSPAAPATPGAPSVTTPDRRPPRTTPSPAAAATPGAPPVTTPDRRPPRTTPSPAAPVEPLAPETPTDSGATTDPAPAERPPYLHRREPLPALVPHEKPAPTAPVTEVVVKPDTPTATQPARPDPSGNYFQNIRREPRTATVTPQEIKTAPVTPQETRTEPEAPQEIKDDDNDTASPRRPGGSPPPRP